MLKKVLHVRISSTLIRVSDPIKIPRYLEIVIEELFEKDACIAKLSTNLTRFLILL